MKSHYRNKITEMEAATKKQERKSNCSNCRLSCNDAGLHEVICEFGPGWSKSR